MKLIYHAQLMIEPADISSRDRPIMSRGLAETKSGELFGSLLRRLQRGRVQSAHRQRKRAAKPGDMISIFQGLRIRDAALHLFAGGKKEAVVGEWVNLPVVMLPLYPDQGFMEDIVFRSDKRDSVGSRYRDAKAFGQVH